MRRRPRGIYINRTMAAVGPCAALAAGVTACGPPRPATGPGAPTEVIVTGAPESNACYAGSIATVSYNYVISWDRVAEVWRRNGWRRSDPFFPATDYQIMGFTDGGPKDYWGG